MSQNRYKLTEPNPNFEEFTVHENGDEVIILQDTVDKVPEESASAPYNYVYANSILNGKLDGPPSNVTPRYQYIDTSANNTAHSSVDSIVVSSPSSLQKPSTSRQASGGDWKEEEVKFISKRYKELSQFIGKDHKLKNKREMWVAISDEINSTFNTKKSPTQCMNKFYNNLHTLENTKKQAGPLYNYQDELESYESMQENLMQEYEMHNRNSTEILIPMALISLAKMNAEAQERRHREYLKAVRGMEERYMQYIAKASEKILT